MVIQVKSKLSTEMLTSKINITKKKKLVKNSKKNKKQKKYFLLGSVTMNVPSIKQNCPHEELFLKWA